jgi:hypothetical protein
MFHAISWASLVVAFLCAILIAVDEIRYPQKMWIFFPQPHLQPAEPDY